MHTALKFGLAFEDHGRNWRRQSRVVCGLIGATVLLAAVMPLRAQESNSSSESSAGKQHSSIGFSASASVSPKDVGLPWYPGAKESKDTPDDNPAIQFGFWGGSADFKLAVLKLESTDAPGKVQAFYRNALARYGHVVLCTASSSTVKKSEGKSSDQLDCESDDKPKPNETLLKAGTRHDQHLVGITPSGSGSIFQLVYVRTPKSED